MASGGGEGGAITRLSREATMLTRRPVPGVKFTPGSETNPFEWTLLIECPEEYNVRGSRRKNPYAGRVLTVTIKYPSTYPFKVPDPYFKAGECYHPNVNCATGEVCGDLFKDEWGPTKNTGDMANMILKFLETPNLDHPFDAEVAALMATDIDKYETNARKIAGSLPKKA